MQVYFDSFDNKNDVLNNFGIEEKDLQGCEILFAYYTKEGYEGNALVVLRNPHSGTFFEVNGSHCSCYGLEGQWELEETTLEVMMKRSGPFFDGVVKAYIQQHLLTETVEDVAAQKSSAVARKM